MITRRGSASIQPPGRRVFYSFAAGGSRESYRKTWDFVSSHMPLLKHAADIPYQHLSNNFTVFLDSRSLAPGDAWDTGLAAAQSDAPITVVLLSANTPAAYDQREEVAAAIAMARDDAAGLMATLPLGYGWCSITRTRGQS